MGKLEDLHASELLAWYDRLSGKLHLLAKGTLWRPTYDIRFTPLLDNKMTVSVFKLEGWVDHDIPSVPTPYEYVQAVEMSGQAPNFVLIITANHPTGIVIRVSQIEGTDPSKIPQSGFGAMSTSDIPIAPNVEIKNDTSSRFALIGVPFDLDVANNVGSEGSITMDYESACLDLNNASIKKGKMVWNFTPLHTGHTQVVVTVDGGQLPYIMQLKFDIFVFYIPGSSPNSASAGDPMLASSQAQDSGTALVKALVSGNAGESFSSAADYFGRYLQNGMKYIQSRYEDVHMFTFKGKSPTLAGVPLISQLSPWIIQFSALVEGKQSYVTIESYVIGSWNVIKQTNKPFPGITELSLPATITADEAFKRAKEAGYLRKLEVLELRKPDDARSNEYAFEFANGSATTIEDLSGPKATESIEEAQVSSTPNVASMNGVAIRTPTKMPKFDPGNQLVGVAA